VGGPILGTLDLVSLCELCHNHRFAVDPRSEVAKASKLIRVESPRLEAAAVRCIAVVWEW